MTEEEKKAIEVLKEEIKSLEEAKIEFSNEIEDKGWLQKNINELDKDIFYKNTLLNLIEKLQKENEEMKKDLSNIVDLMYLNVIKKEGETYKPIKNLSKQDVYEIYYRIQEILETRRIRRKYIVSNEEKKK